MGEVRRSFADCAGLLVDPPARVALHVGEKLTVHMAMAAPGGSAHPAALDPLPTSTDATVLRRTSVSADGSTGTWQAERLGQALLLSAGYCLHLPSMTEFEGSCPALAVTAGR